MSRRADMLQPVVAATACAVAPALLVIGAAGPVRTVAILLVLGLAPGTALLGPRPGLELGLVVGVSLAVCVVVAEGMLALGAWAPRPATMGLALLSLAVLVIRLCRDVANRRTGLSEPQQTSTDL